MFSWFIILQQIWKMRELGCQNGSHNCWKLEPWHIIFRFGQYLILYVFRSAKRVLHSSIFLFVARPRAPGLPYYGFRRAFFAWFAQESPVLARYWSPSLITLVAIGVKLRQICHSGRLRRKALFWDSRKQMYETLHLFIIFFLFEASFPTIRQVRRSSGRSVGVDLLAEGC